jgi:hypothetical protein
MRRTLLSRISASAALRFGLVAAPTVVLTAPPAAFESVAHATATPPGAGEYIPLTPTKVIGTAASGSYVTDTEISQSWGPQRPIQAGQTLNYNFQGSAGVPASGASAVALDVLTQNGVSGTPANGYFFVYPATSGLSAPDQSNDPHPYPETLANRGDGGIAENTVIVPLGDYGQVSFYEQSTATSVDFTVYVVGYIQARVTRQRAPRTRP